MNKPKVLHISFGGLGSGGVASVIHSISEPLQNDFDFHCVVFRKKGRSEERFEKYGKLHRLNCYGRVGLGKVIDVLTRPFVMTIGCYRICKKEHIDIIHCHNGNEEFFFLLGAKLAGVKKKIAHSHTTKSPIRRGIFSMYKDKVIHSFITLLADVKIGCSENACKDFFKSEDYIVINNAINLEKFIWDYKQEDRTKFVHVGRYDYLKNQAFVIDIFEIINKKIPEATLKLIGFGSDKEMLKNLVANKKLENCISLVDGTNTDIHKELSNANIMIFPSRSEGFGIVLLEAQASGCFCFTSDVVPNETNVGLQKQLSLEESASAWANTILDYMADKTAVSRESIYNNLAQFDILTISKKYKEIYEQ